MNILLKIHWLYLILTHMRIIRYRVTSEVSLQPKMVTLVQALFVFNPFNISVTLECIKAYV